MSENKSTLEQRMAAAVCALTHRFNGVEVERILFHYDLIKAERRALGWEVMPTKEVRDAAKD